jgi:hypothetical protein
MQGYTHVRAVLAAVEAEQHNHPSGEDDSERERVEVDYPIARAGPGLGAPQQ